MKNIVITALSVVAFATVFAAGLAVVENKQTPELSAKLSESEQMEKEEITRLIGWAEHDFRNYESIPGLSPDEYELLMCLTVSETLNKIKNEKQKTLIRNKYYKILYKHSK
jgi:hypothetical protein